MKEHPILTILISAFFIIAAVVLVIEEIYQDLKDKE
jgi:hypothetical protein